MLRLTCHLTNGDWNNMCSLGWRCNMVDSCIVSPKSLQFPSAVPGFDGCSSETVCPQERRRAADAPCPFHIFVPQILFQAWCVDGSFDGLMDPSMAVVSKSALWKQVSVNSCLLVPSPRRLTAETWKIIPTEKETHVQPVSTIVFKVSIFQNSRVLSGFPRYKMLVKPVFCNHEKA